MSEPGTRELNQPDQQTPPQPKTDDDPLRTKPYDSVEDRAEVPGEFSAGALLKGRYLLERVLGSGAMGQVYQARDLTLDRLVAVKVIRPRDPHLRNRTICEARLREAFAAEARIGAGLTHPAIATVFDFGFHGNEPFIVFEYIDGLTLSDLLAQRGRLPLEEARLVLGPLAQALDFAHSRHVVHRDLKPENLRATGQGHFKILDLGLAQEFRRESEWQFAGTPAYAAPEQAAGQPCDGRADQYALALIAQEVLTGHRVFEHHDWQELLRMQCEQEPPSPRTIVPDLPEAVCVALARALDKDPNRRFASCEEFAVALGCQFLSAPPPAPEILRLTAARGMSGQWRSTGLRISRRESAVHLALAADALWVVYRGEIRRWPLASVAGVRRNWWGNQLHLRVSDAAKPSRQSFLFASRKECRQWHDQLLSLTADQAPGGAGRGSQLVPPVVLLRRRPEMRHQVLGAVEYKDAKPRRARVGLRLRAAMMGADAVVDVQEERLPEFKRTVRRASGMAIRAVDQAGRLEVRARWFADEASRIGYWMLALVGVSAVGTLLASLLLSAVSAGGIGVPLAPGETLARRLATSAAVIGLIHAWPLAAALLARLTLWPQLLWPAALSVLALGARPLAFLLGLLTTAAATGKWAGLAVHSLMLLDPINIALLIFGWFIYRRAAAAVADYRALVSAAEQRLPVRRRAVSGMAAWVSPVFAVSLAGFMAWTGYVNVATFALPGNDAWTEREALKLFNGGLAIVAQQPAQAEQAFRRALPLWEKLTTAATTRPEYRHNLAVTHQNIGAALARQNKLRDAEDAFHSAVAAYDRLEAFAPSYQGHKPDRAKVEQALAELRLIMPMWEDNEEQREAQRLAAAGQHREAAEVYRQALERHERRADEFPDRSLFTKLLAAKQTRLAWLLVVCPDLQVRDPARAVTLAKEAVGHVPGLGACWNTLGAAHYRAGSWEESRAALERSMQLRGGGDGFDWYFLAMTCQQLGRPEVAKQWLDKAVRWTEQPPPAAADNPLLTQQREVLRREVELLRREAEELILGKVPNPEKQ
jgi:tetratricopeptide (TPR) repeat protein/tRNA A-37 threonylcarbamoyl transferase component Bud32